MKAKNQLVKKISNLFGMVLIMLGAIRVPALSQVSSVYAADQEVGAAAIALPEISRVHGDWISLAILAPVLAEEGEDPPAEELPAEAPPAEAPPAEAPPVEAPPAEEPPAEAPPAEEPPAEEPLAEEPSAEEMPCEGECLPEPAVETVEEEAPEGEDLCPDDDTKLEPGVCGCGVADDDSDLDGTVDCEDACPLDDLNTCQAPAEGEGVPACEGECLPEPAVETVVEEDLTEVVEAIAETGVVLINEEEEAMPMASEEAVELLSSGDPWFIRNNGTVDEKICYVPATGIPPCTDGSADLSCCAVGCDECHSTGTPMQDAIDDISSNGMPYDGTINVEAGTYAGFDIIGFSGSDLVIQGAGIGTTNFNSQVYLTGNSANITLRNFSTVGRNGRYNTSGVFTTLGDTPTILALNNSGTISLEYLDVVHNSDTQIYIYSHTGDVVLDNVNSHGNGNDKGTWINNSAGTGDVEISNSDFYSDTDDALYVESSGSVLLNNVTATDSGNGSGDYGADIRNQGSPTNENVTILNSVFNNNMDTGLWVLSSGQIILDNVTANDNYNNGAYLETSGDKVIVKDSEFLDTVEGLTQEYGLQINNTGSHVTSLCNVSITTSENYEELQLNSPFSPGSYVYNICSLNIPDNDGSEIYVYGGTSSSRVIFNIWPWAGDNSDIQISSAVDIVNQTSGDCGENCEFDYCPDDPNKTEPGVCGCGVPDDDSDGDGIPEA